MSNLKPARVTPTGNTIRAEIEARGWNQLHLAQVIGRSKQFVSELLSGKRTVTVETALLLEAALDVPAVFWLRRDAAYQIWKADRSVLRLDEVHSRATLKAS